MLSILQKISQTRYTRSLLLIFTLLLSLSLASPVSAASHVYTPSTTTSTPVLADPQELANFLDGVLNAQLKENHIPGATISVVKDGHLLLARGYGDANIARQQPVVADTTLFRAGSVSKMFTWTAIMQLAEEGKVDLHTDINTYLKTFKIPATYPQPITLANLLTHTAGFEEEPKGIFVDRIGDLTPLSQWLPSHLPARVRPPGSITSYSNYGATLAGYIVEQVSGMPFDQYIEQHIFQPLGMKHSSFRQPLPDQLAPDVSQGYTYTNGTYSANPFEAIEVAPAGSLSTTATDMANFMIAHLQNGRFGNQRILQEATSIQMQQQQFSNDPRVSGMAYGFYEQHINNQRLLAHAGDTQWFHSLMALIPTQHIGLFVSFNGVNGGTVRDTLLQAFMDRYFPVSSTQPSSQPLPGYHARISQIVGDYWSTRRNETSYFKLINLVSSSSVSDLGNGRISVSMNGATSTLWEVKPWVFQDVISQRTMVFRSTYQGTTMFLDNVPYEGFTKTAWYEATMFQLGMLVVCLLFFLIVLLCWPFRLLRAMRLKYQKI